MLKLPRMLMIGSAGRNVGKTELACSLIKRFGLKQKIVGVKVTTIARKDGTCPRGGKGCGVCSSLKGDYCITEESNGPAQKDTSRLLAAGADRVFWLRVMRKSLHAGVSDLLDIVGPDAVSICESNSLREVVEPALFLMVKDKKSDRFKASAARVREHVDRMIPFDGTGFDAVLDAVGFVDGRWILREHATAIVLAGGESKRMKTDKTLLPINGRPMIEHVWNQLRYHFDEILVSASEAGKYVLPGVRVVPDRTPGQGPLMGIASALEVSTHDLNLVVACDIPEIDIALARQMLAQAEGYDVVVPRAEQSLLEPLFAVYRKSVLGVMQETLCSGERRIRAVFDRCKVKYFNLPDTRRLRNINTMEEYTACFSPDHGG